MLITCHFLGSSRSKMIFIADLNIYGDTLSVSSNSSKDTVVFSMNQNLTTDWITSLDFAGYELYTPNFTFETDLYTVLTGTNNLFCAVKMNAVDGYVDNFNWYIFSSADYTMKMQFFIVRIYYFYLYRKLRVWYFNFLSYIQKSSWVWRWNII